MRPRARKRQTQSHHRQRADQRRKGGSAAQVPDKRKQTPGRRISSAPKRAVRSAVRNRGRCRPQGRSEQRETASRAVSKACRGRPTRHAPYLPPWMVLVKRALIYPQDRYRKVNAPNVRPDRHPFRPLADGLFAYWRRAHGAVQLALCARSCGGKFLLRIEDTDTANAQHPQAAGGDPCSGWTWLGSGPGRRGGEPGWPRCRAACRGGASTCWRAGAAYKCFADAPARSPAFAPRPSAPRQLCAVPKPVARCRSRNASRTLPYVDPSCERRSRRHHGDPRSKCRAMSPSATISLDDMVLLRPGRHTGLHAGRCGGRP